MTTLTLGRYEIELSNEDKLLFPGKHITKGDLIDYYVAIADAVLPHLKDRPLTMHRFPDGIDGEDFYQKDTPDYFPDWIETVTLKKEGGSVRHVICNNQATLAYLANQACITPHYWLSRTDQLNFPDLLVFDLDPSKEDAFDDVRSGAFALRKLLEELGLRPFLQTTGSRGLHIVTPLKRTSDFDTARQFARDVAEDLGRQQPELLTTEQRKEKRRGRVFIDTGRNAYGQTAVTPYAVRAKPGAPIATPIDWEELGDRSLHPRRYTLENIRRRLGQKDDPWADIHKHGRSLHEPMQRLARRAKET